MHVGRPLCRGLLSRKFRHSDIPGFKSFTMITNFISPDRER